MADRRRFGRYRRACGPRQGLRVV